LHRRARRGARVHLPSSRRVAHHRRGDRRALPGATQDVRERVMTTPYARLRATALAALCMAALAAPGARAAETILVGSVGSASANLWPVTVGDKKGFFTAEGIKIDMVFVQANAGVIQQLTVDAVNVSVGSGLVDPIRAVDKGAPVAIVRIEMQRPPYTLLAKPAIKRIADLKGKVVSVGGAKGGVGWGGEGHPPHLLRAHAGAERRRSEGGRPDLRGRAPGAAAGAAVGPRRRRDPHGAVQFPRRGGRLHQSRANCRRARHAV